MATTGNTGQAAHPSPVGGLPASWQDRAARLRELLASLARARAAETEQYARAFLNEIGAVEARTQAARLAAGQSHLAAELAAADVAAYQLMLRAAMGELWAAETEGGGQ